jgi:hypothetical protein
MNVLVPVPCKGGMRIDKGREFETSNARVAATLMASVWSCMDWIYGLETRKDVTGNGTGRQEGIMKAHQDLAGAAACDDATYAPRA